MIGDFELQIRNVGQANLTQMFEREYPNSLGKAYAHSSQRKEDMFRHSDFCSGTHTRDSLLLIYRLQADTLRCYVETDSMEDLSGIKKAVNMYFGQVTRILNRNKVKWKHPEATITIGELTFYGFINNRKKQLRSIFEERWEKLLVAPSASLIISYLAIQFNWLSKQDYVTDVKKAVTLTAEAYLGALCYLVIKVLLKSNKKEFSFKILE